MNEMQIFNYRGNEVRTIEKDGEPWWVLKDVCEILDIGQAVRVAERLDEDEVSQTHIMDSLGRRQNTYIINESGSYSVILRSDKPEAKPFRRWVTHEVLPSIRKTGGYCVSKEAGRSYKGVQVVTLKEMEEMSGIKSATLRNRLRHSDDFVQGVDWWKLEGQEAMDFTKRYGMTSANCLLLVSRSGVQRMMARDAAARGQNLPDLAFFQQKCEVLERKAKVLRGLLDLSEKEEDMVVKGCYMQLLATAMLKM